MSFAAETWMQSIHKKKNQGNKILRILNFPLLLAYWIQVAIW